MYYVLSLCTITMYYVLSSSSSNLWSEATFASRNYSHYYLLLFAYLAVTIVVTTTPHSQFGVVLSSTASRATHQHTRAFHKWVAYYRLHTGPTVTWQPTLPCSSQPIEYPDFDSRAVHLDLRFANSVLSCAITSLWDEAWLAFLIRE